MTPRALGTGSGLPSSPLEADKGPRLATQSACRGPVPHERDIMILRRSYFNYRRLKARRSGRYSRR